VTAPTTADKIPDNQTTEKTVLFDPQAPKLVQDISFSLRYHQDQAIDPNLFVADLLFVRSHAPARTASPKSFDKEPKTAPRGHAVQDSTRLGLQDNFHPHTSDTLTPR